MLDKVNELQGNVTLSGNVFEYFFLESDIENGIFLGLFQFFDW